jgi:hypothetical protein
MPCSPLLLVLDNTSCVANFYAPPYRRFFFACNFNNAALRNALIVSPYDACHNYALMPFLLEVVQMEIESMALLAVLAGLIGVAGYALYRYFKAHQKKTLLRPPGR